MLRAFAFCFLFFTLSDALAENKVRIIFFEDSATLPIGAAAKLDGVIKKYQKDQKDQKKNRTRLEIKAYAVLSNKPSWSAFRLSLKRALAVRDYLLQHKVRVKDIILMPQGNICESPCQRVDISLRQ